MLEERWDLLNRVIGLTQTTFISAEPLLEPLDFRYLARHYRRTPDWIIVGGESGPDFRLLKLEWVRKIYDQCQKYGIKFFMKQDAGPKPGMRGSIPDDLWVQEMPDEI